MDTAEIYRKLTDIFHDVFDDDALVLKPDLTAEDVEGWDSLTHIRLIVTVERAFHVKFPASVPGQLKNVQELVELIQSKLE